MPPGTEALDLGLAQLASNIPIIGYSVLSVTWCSGSRHTADAASPHAACTSPDGHRSVVASTVWMIAPSCPKPK